MADNLSNVPPVVTLSGIPGVGDSFSGASQGALSGTGTSSGGLFGMESGPDLLSQLLAQASGSGADVGGNMLGLGQSVAAPSFGQQTGGLGAGAFGQQAGVVAGQSAAGGAGPSAGSNIDPLAVIQKALGLGAKTAGLLDSRDQTASPTQSAPQGQPTGQPQGGAFVTPQGGAGTASPLAGAGGITAGFTGGTSGVPDVASVFQQYLNTGQFPNQGLFNPQTGGAPFTSLTDYSPESIQNFLGQLTDPSTGLTGLSALGGAGGGDLSQFLQSAGANPESLAGSFSGGGLAGGLSGAGAASSGLGALASLLSAVQGFQSGSAGGAISGVQGLFSALQAANALAAGTQAGSAALAASPALEAVSAALSAAAAPAAAIAPIIQGLVYYLNNAEQMRARSSGVVNNPIKGALSSKATAGVGQDLGLLNSIQANGGLSQLTTDQEQSLLPMLLNNLMPYYGTAQGGRGAIKASDTFTGGTGEDRSTPLGGADQYTENFNQAQTGLVNVLNDLLSRGVSYEQLGNLPGVNPNWTMQNLDADPAYVQNFYNRNPGQYDTQGQSLLSSLYAGATQTPVTAWQSSGEGGMEVPTGAVGYSMNGQLLPSNLTTQDLLQAAMGSAPYGPDQVTHASGLVSSMFGGPLWTAIARMGAGGPQMQSLIQQHFNPWATVGGFSPEQLYASLMPILQQQAMTNPVGAPGSSGAGAAGPGGPGAGPGGA